MIATLPDQDVMVRAMRQLRRPESFARHWLGHELWDTQEAMMRSVAENRRTAVKGCHSSSKTFCAADAVLWWVTRFPDGAVITTASSWTQVKEQMWRKIHQAAAGARYRIDTLNRTDMRQSPDSEENYAIGLSTNQGVRFQGFHGHLLIIVDEGPGVDPEIWEAIEGASAGGIVHILTLGNPTVIGGRFYDAFTTERDLWKTFTINAFDTPNLRGITLEDLSGWERDDPRLDDAPIPYLITRRWVWERISTWGVTSPVFQSRVLGEFPKQSEDALIAISWLEAAQKREGRDNGKGPLHAGIDVAGPGEDETVLYVRAGSHLVAQHVWRDPDPRGAVLAALRPYQDRMAMVNVDSAGMGYYFAKHIADNGFRVTEINVGEAALYSATEGDPEFYLLKATLYWALRQRFADGDVSGLTDDLAISQLAALRYKHDARGRIVVESKDSMRARGVKSPDRAEAIMLAFADVRGGSRTDLKLPVLRRGG